MTEKILVTGACGLVGSDLVLELMKKYGKDNVHSTDIKSPESFSCSHDELDVTQLEDIEKLIKEQGITQIYHLAGILSAGSEKNPQLAWDVNLGGLKNVLDLAVKYKLRVFWPSSIAVFGPNTPKESTPQHTIIEPTTMYGVAKLAGEMLCQYYHQKFGLDVRSLRYPGLIGYKAPPGDGTTEYAVHIFYGAIKDKKYEVFLKEETILPMMYMDDAIKGTIDLMDADSDKLTVWTSYNFSAIDFAPKEIVAEIQKFMPEFEVTYKPGNRQKIAESWPKIIDDSLARRDWGWKHEYDLPSMVKIMMEKVKEKLGD